jgi:hypothetical protein
MGAIKVRLNEEYLYFEKGGLRTDSQQIPIAQVADVDANQTMTQKARSVGTVRVHVQRSTGVETVLLDDLPDFRDGVTHINQVSRSARAREQQQRNTQHVNYNGAQMSAPPTVAAPSGTDEIFAQIEKLGQLRDKGFISTEDFDTKKAELLGRI